jgi:hypothetical protein
MQNPQEQQNNLKDKSMSMSMTHGGSSLVEMFWRGEFSLMLAAGSSGKSLSVPL